MNVILFGASGMVGQGALRECLLDPEVGKMLSVGRSPLPQAHAKLTELVTPRLDELAPFSAQLTGYDACFFCLGVSASGLNEADYRRVTYDLTLGAAQLLATLNPGMTFLYVSGAGTDSTEHGRVMWARVKGATENALQRLPFKAVYLLRPGIIRPLHGIKSKTKLYRVFYELGGPLLSLLAWLRPAWFTSTEQLGRVMLRLAREGGPHAVLEISDLRALASPEK